MTGEKTRIYSANLQVHFGLGKNLFVSSEDRGAYVSGKLFKDLEHYLHRSEDKSDLQGVEQSLFREARGQLIIFGRRLRKPAVDIIVIPGRKIVQIYDPQQLMNGIGAQALEGFIGRNYSVDRGRVRGLVPALERFRADLGSRNAYNPA